MLCFRVVVSFRVLFVFFSCCVLVLCSSGLLWCCHSCVAFCVVFRVVLRCCVVVLCVRVVFFV